MTRPIAFLDTETDGLTKNRRIWEIAIIRREADGTETEWHEFLEINLANANLQGLYIGRFYDRHPLGRVLAGHDSRWPLTGPRIQMPNGKLVTEPPVPVLIPSALAAAHIAKLTHGATIVGAVPNFDTEPIAALLRKHKLTPSWDHRLRCVETLAAGYVGRELGGLKACATELGIAPWDEHTALGDARAARDIYDAIIDRKALAA